MKYMLLFYWNEAAVPDNAAELFSVWQDVSKNAAEAGVLLSRNGLKSVSNATTVRVRDHKTLTTDGPFAETHEQLGGFFLMDCKDLDEAVDWAAKVPPAWYGSVEIRPLWDQ